MSKGEAIAYTLGQLVLTVSIYLIASQIGMEVLEAAITSILFTAGICLIRGSDR